MHAYFYSIIRYNSIRLRAGIPGSHICYLEYAGGAEFMFESIVLLCDSDLVVNKRRLATRVSVLQPGFSGVTKGTQWRIGPFRVGDAILDHQLGLDRLADQSFSPTLFV